MLKWSSKTANLYHAKQFKGNYLFQSASASQLSSLTEEPAPTLLALGSGLCQAERREGQTRPCGGSSWQLPATALGSLSFSCDTFYSVNDPRTSFNVLWVSVWLSERNGNSFICKRCSWLLNLFSSAIAVMDWLVVILVAACIEGGKAETALLNYCRAGLGV